MLKQKIKKMRWWLAGLAAIILAILFSGLWSGKKNGSADLITARLGTVTQEVAVTGQLKPAESVKLSFERSGRIRRILKDEGNTVRRGDVLVELDASELLAQLREAEANVAVQKARLNDLQSGARPEDVRIKETELKKAEQDLANIYQGVPDLLDDMYGKAVDAVRKQLDGIFVNPETSSPRLSYDTTNSQAKIDAETNRVSVGKNFSDWQNQLTTLHALDASRAQPDVDNAIIYTRTRLNSVRTLINAVTDTLASPVGISDTTAAAYRTSVATARTNINAALASLNNQQQSIATQQITVQRAGNQLDLTRAGSTPAQIETQRAQVGAAQASADSVRAQLAKMFLVSPIDGIVTKVSADPGETVSPGVNIIAIISNSNLEIEVNVPEVDIGKVKVGNPVHITFDAFPGESFNGAVTFIDPAETIVDGVTNFKVKISLPAKDDRLKSGLTANLKIETARKENILVLPQYAIIEKSQGGTFVKRLSGNQKTFTEVPVELGLRGQDGLVEITGGLVPGDQVENIGVKKTSK